MTHAREQIRTAFITALTGTTSAGANIIAGGVFPVHDSILPALQIHSREEETDIERGRINHIQHRDLTVTVIVHQKLLDDIDDFFDDISEEIETIIFNDAGISAMTHCIDLVTTETETINEGEVQIGICTLPFQVRYMTEKGKPGVFLL